MNIQAFMLTCPAREEILRQTIKELRQTDWGEGPIVFTDETTCERLQERQERTSFTLLESALDYPAWDFMLFLEDDLFFNAHLRHNLEHWAPMQCGALEFGSLYNPNIRELVKLPAKHYFVADPEAVYGSQAFVLSRGCAKFIIEHWGEVKGMQDIKCSRLAAMFTRTELTNFKPRLYYHMPSLVQHNSQAKSTWGGFVHTARDFDQNWKA